MLIWILIIVILIIAIIFIIKSIFPRNVDSSGNNIFPNSPDVKYPGKISSATSIGKLKAADVLPNIEKIKEKREFNWQKLHENINPTDNPAIQSKLVKLIQEEREYIIIDKFIYFTKLNPHYEILQVLDEVEKNALSYKEILSRLGNR